MAGRPDADLAIIRACFRDVVLCQRMHDVIRWRSTKCSQAMVVAWRHNVGKELLSASWLLSCSLGSLGVGLSRVFLWFAGSWCSTSATPSTFVMSAAATHALAFFFLNHPSPSIAVSSSFLLSSSMFLKRR